MADYDAVIVPGGGVREGFVLPAWVEARFDRALEIAGGAPIIALSAGTVHRAPPLDAAGRPITEAEAGARYLLRRGYPWQLVLTETVSYDTIGNAYFCRAVHTDPAGFRRLAVVTSEFHMPRVEAIFRWVFSLAPSDPPYRLAFVTAPDAAMPEPVRAGRMAKEQAALAELPRLTAKLTTMAEMHRWLFTEHKAYAAGLAPQTVITDGALRESY